MYNFSNKKILITGASGGIGKAIVAAFSNYDCEIYASGSNEEKLKKLVAEFPESKITPITCNLANRDEIKNLTDIAKDSDILICNAGITKDNVFMRLQENDWDDVLDINLTSSFLLAKGLIRNMMKKRYGRIINITSVVGFSGNPGQANYCASKAGIVGFTKSLAQEVASRNITVNTVAPGFIATNMTDKLTDEQKESINQKIPMAKMGNPVDIANAVIFLASDNSNYITGQTIHVNGGMYM